MNAHSHTSNRRLFLTIEVVFLQSSLFKYYIQTFSQNRKYAKCLCLTADILFPFICPILALVSPFLSYHTILFGWCAPHISLHVSVFLSYFEDELWHVRNSYQQACTLQHIRYRGGKKLKSVGRSRKEVREHRYTCCTDKVLQLILILLVSFGVSSYFSKCLGMYEPSQIKPALHTSP